MKRKNFEIKIIYELGDLGNGTARAGIRHHADRVELVHVIHDLALDVVRRLAPNLDNALVALLVGEQAALELLFNRANLLFGGFQNRLLLRRHDNVGHGHGDGADGGILVALCLNGIEHFARDCRAVLFMSALSPELQELARRTNEISSHIQGFQANVCLNYGGRDELLRAARHFAADCVEGRCRPEELDEERFSGYLFTDGLPDPELIIRTSGEERLSGFLLWQCAYSELYFCDTLWPDFGPEDMDRAIVAYQQRDRRFGGIK